MTRQPPEDFAEFVRARSGALLRAAWLLTGDAARAEDLLQTALAKVWPRWGRVVAGSSPDAYVRKVLVSTYLSWRRRRWRFEVPTVPLPENVDGRDVAGEAALRDTVHRALAGLSRQQRAVIVLRYVEDLSVAETAELLGCSLATVKVQSGRALAALRVDPNLSAESHTEVER